MDNKNPLGDEVSILRQRSRARGPSDPLSPTPTVTTSSQILEDTTQKASQHERIGTTDDGIVFHVPEMNNVFSSLAYTKNWGWPTAMLMTLVTSQLVVALFWDLDVYTHGAIFLCWRFAYNLGLGTLLHMQSNYRTITHFVEGVMRRPESPAARMIRWFADTGMSNDFDCRDYPAPYTAWLAFRWLTDLILVNDSWAVLLLFAKAYSVPEEISTTVVLQYIVGATLVAFNYWVKVDAHRCIGEYCWYWGDFFFRFQQNLTFDGIFELFPHPMYTVGYSLFYGVSLISRSYTMFLFCVSAHAMQMMFLVFVEEPHIRRLYGQETSVVDPESRKILYDSSKGLFPSKNDTITFWHATMWRSNDLSLILCCIYGVSFALLTSNPWWAVAQAVLWRFCHWIAVSYVLYYQSREKMWTKHFTSQGRSLHEAFNHWKRSYNLSLTMNHVVFMACAARFFTIPPEGITSELTACVVGGIVLMLINVYSSSSSFAAIGEFGWFYGDFFIPKELYRPKLHYTGIHRYLNNPDCVTGYAAMYGLALMTRNTTMLFIACFAQIMNIMFVFFVEVPHMRRVYRDQRRQQSPIPLLVQEKVKKQLDKVGDQTILKKTTSIIRDSTKGIQTKLVSEILDLYKHLSQSGMADYKNTERVTRLLVPSSARLDLPLEVRFEAPEDHDKDDWIGIYPVHVRSFPGRSFGKWRRVPRGSTGSVAFQPSKLPEESGIYEVRYHLGNTYTVVAAQPVIFRDTIHSDDDLPSTGSGTLRRSGSMSRITLSSPNDVDELQVEEMKGYEPRTDAPPSPVDTPELAEITVRTPSSSEAQADENDIVVSQPHSPLKSKVDMDSDRVELRDPAHIVCGAGIEEPVTQERVSSLGASRKRGFSLGNLRSNPEKA